MGGTVSVVRGWWPEMHADAVELLRAKVPYRLGAEVDLGEWLPTELDCSEMVQVLRRRRGLYAPDGSWIQHKKAQQVFEPQPGDLGFFARPEKATTSNPVGVYHVGMLLSSTTIIESRAKDRGRYGRIIVRPRGAWENYEPFWMAGGWFRLPDEAPLEPGPGMV